VDETTPFFKNIRYSHITGTNIKKAGEIRGLPEAPMEDVTLTDVYLQAETGIEVKFTKDVDFRNVEINAEKGSALKISTSSEIELDNVTSREPVKGKAVVVLDNVKNAVIRDCSVKEGTTNFLELRGAGSQEIVLINNRLEKEQKAIKVSDGASLDAIVNK